MVKRNEAVLCIEGVARLIYETVFRPGEWLDGDVMPTFEEARADSIGGYERAVRAAELVVSRIQQQARRTPQL